MDAELRNHPGQQIFLHVNETIQIDKSIVFSATNPSQIKIRNVHYERPDAVAVPSVQEAEALLLEVDAL